MSRMLSLSFHAWNLARREATDGRYAEASRKLELVIIDDSLPTNERVQAHRLAGSLHLEAGRFAKARRQFRAAICLKSSQADSHYRLGLAIERDPYGSERAAAKRYRQATRLDETNAVYWAALGRAAIRIGKIELAKRALSLASKLAPTDADVLNVVIDTLLEAGWTNSAWRIATKARFLAPRDRDIEALWNRVRFEMSRAKQSRERQPRRATSAAVLPFVRYVDTEGQKHIVHRNGEAHSEPIVM